MKIEETNLKKNVNVETVSTRIEEARKGEVAAKLDAARSPDWGIVRTSVPRWRWSRKVAARTVPLVGPGLCRWPFSLWITSDWTQTTIRHLSNTPTWPARKASEAAAWTSNNLPPTDQVGNDVTSMIQFAPDQRPFALLFVHLPPFLPL